MKRPSQLDVAKVAGVSRSTVSHVLNGLKSENVYISEETRKRVEKAIEELGYVPDASARALRSGNTKTLGLFVPDIRNPHFWEMAEGVEQEARRAGYRLLLSNISLNYEYANEILDDLLHRRTDGLIVMGWPTFIAKQASTYLSRFSERRLAIVDICDHYDTELLMDRVASDYQATTREAMLYLLGLNHKRIAMLYGVALHELGTDRLAPYEVSLRTAGLPVEDELIIECGATIEDGYQATQKLLALSPRPTAIITINDLLAMGSLRAATDLGLSVPRDVSILSYDDITMAKYTIPRLTTISKDIISVGRIAVKLLLSRLQQPEQPYQMEMHPARLIIRESTGPAPY